MSKTKDGAVKKPHTMLRERDTQGTVLDRSTHIADLGAVVTDPTHKDAAAVLPRW